MYTAKQVQVYRDDAEGHVTVKMANAPIFVADGLPHPGPFFKFTPQQARKTALRLLWACVKAIFGRFDRKEGEQLPYFIGLATSPLHVSRMVLDLYKRLGIPYNPSMPMEVQRWRVAEELRKNMKTCDEVLLGGFERMVNDLEGSVHQPPWDGVQQWGKLTKAVEEIESSGRTLGTITPSEPLPMPKDAYDRVRKVLDDGKKAIDAYEPSKEKK